MLKKRNSIPGFQEGGMNVDPVSGNEVPTGSLPEEVRDDVDAKLSPGEFVIPADVVRFIGLERLMKMRDEAKKGIQRMADIGQMGNADEVGEESNSGYEDDGFESEIDDILGEVEREGNGEGVDKQMEMAFGGYVKSGTDFSKAPDSYFDVRYYKGPNNQKMFITHINGKPMTPVPEGFKEMTPEEAIKIGSEPEEEKKSTGATTTTTEGYSATELDPATAKWLEEEDKLQKVAEAEGRKGPRDLRMEKVAGILEKITGNLPFVGTAKKVVDWAKQQLPPGTPAGFGTAPLTSGTGGSLMSAAAADAYAGAKAARATDLAATKAAQRTVEYIQSGYDPYSASQRAVDEAKQAEAVTKAAEESYLYGQPSPTVPSTGATASPVLSRTIESRTLDLSGESSIGTPGSTPGEGGIDDNWGMAKGGLVNKRQYPTKKKKGKGIAASKK